MAKEMADAAREAAEQKVLKKQAEAEKDIAMMKAQMAVMEEQEQQRAQSFQRMKDKQGKAQAQYEANAGSAQARLQREDTATVSSLNRLSCNYPILQHVGLQFAYATGRPGGTCANSFACSIFAAA
eukprot:symbB.v1.2.026779.t1/scaffold2704.1/size72676/4